MKNSISLIAVLLSIIGIAMHAIVCFIAAEGGPNLFTLVLFLAASVPYAVSWFIARRWPSWSLGALAIAVVSLLINGLTVYGTFFAPTSSTEALSLLVAPVINLVLMLPLGVIFGWLGRRFLFSAA
jgi:hypothetical protein